MRAFHQALLLALSLGITGVVDAHKLVSKTSDSYDVFCDNGQFVGTMYWNGSRWSDGLRWHENKDELAKLMVKAQGTACT